MAQERPATPEKQLLSLIENPKAKSANTQTQATKHHSLSFLSFGAWKGRLSFLKEGFKKWLKGGGFRRLNVKTVNKILGLCIFILAFYFISSLAISIVNLKRMPDLKFEIEKGAKLASFPKTTLLKAVSFYLEKVRQRDIFKMGPRKTEDAKKTVAKPGISKIVEATQHFKLVGISWSDDPDAMIENTKALRTYFVKRGGMIGEVKVEAIFKDKVVLSYDGEEVELK